MSATVVIDNILPYTQAIATNLQTVFDTNWTADTAGDVIVYARATGVAADDFAQVIDPVDYTVTFVGVEEFVRITFGVGRTTADIVTIIRMTPAERMNLYTNTNFTPSMLNGDFGRMIMITQQNETLRSLIGPHYNISDTIDLADVDGGQDIILPKLGANQVWAKNADDDAIIAYDVPAGGGLAPSTATYILQTANAGLPNAQATGALATGALFNTVTSGILVSRVLTGTANQIDIANGDGSGGAPTFSITANPTIPGTAGMGIPSGTTAQRVTPTGTSIGLRFNTDINALEAYISSAWVAIPSAVAGIFLELAGGTMAGTINMDSNTITNLPIPTTASEPATKGYVDGLVLNVIQACNYATTANLVGYTYANGTAGVGATLTAGANGAFSTDGASPALNDRIFVSFQTAQEENGIYTLSTVGDGSNPAILTRATDWDVSADMQAGDTVVVVAGTLYAGSNWMMTQTAAITVGTTAITWIDISVPENLVTIDGTQTITGDKEFTGLTEVPTPATATEAANKGYVDAQITAADVGSWVLISTATASSSATIDFTDLDSTYIAYKIIISNVLPATLGTALLMRCSSNNGSTYYAAGGDYSWSNNSYVAAASVVDASSSSDTFIRLLNPTDTQTNVSGNELAMEVTLFSPSTTDQTKCTWDGHAFNTSAIGFSIIGAGVNRYALAIDAIRFLFGTGNIASGSFKLYGIKST